MKGVIQEDRKTEIKQYLEGVITWQDSNQMASSEEFISKKGEVETYFKDIMANIQEAMGQSGQGPVPESHSADDMPSGKGPTIEEVD